MSYSKKWNFLCVIILFSTFFACNETSTLGETENDSIKALKNKETQSLVEPYSHDKLEVILGKGFSEIPRKNFDNLRLFELKNGSNYILIQSNALHKKNNSNKYVENRSKSNEEFYEGNDGVNFFTFRYKSGTDSYGYRNDGMHDNVGLVETFSSSFEEELFRVSKNYNNFFF